MSGIFNGTAHGCSAAANAANMSDAPRKRKAQGPEHDRDTKPLTEVTDDQVRAMRALFDFRGWSKAELAKYYGISYAATARLIDGMTRAKVLHSEADVPRGL